MRPRRDETPGERTPGASRNGAAWPPSGLRRRRGRRCGGCRGGRRGGGRRGGGGSGGGGGRGAGAAAAHPQAGRRHPVGADVVHITRSRPQRVPPGDGRRDGPDVRALGVVVAVEPLACQGGVAGGVVVVLVAVLVAVVDAFPLDPADADGMVGDDGDVDRLARVDGVVVNLDRHGRAGRGGGTRGGRGGGGASGRRRGGLGWRRRWLSDGAGARLEGAVHVGVRQLTG